MWALLGTAFKSMAAAALKGVGGLIGQAATGVLESGAKALAGAAPKAITPLIGNAAGSGLATGTAAGANLGSVVGGAMSSGANGIATNTALGAANPISTAVSNVTKAPVGKGIIGTLQDKAMETVNPFKDSLFKTIDGFKNKVGIGQNMINIADTVKAAKDLGFGKSYQPPENFSAQGTEGGQNRNQGFNMPPILEHTDDDLHPPDANGNRRFKQGYMDRANAPERFNGYGQQ